MIDPVSIVAVVFGCFASKWLYGEESNLEKRNHPMDLSAYDSNFH